MTDRKLYILAVAISGAFTGWVACTGDLFATLIGLAFTVFTGWCAMNPSSLYDRTWGHWEDDDWT